MKDISELHRLKNEIWAERGKGVTDARLAKWCVAIDQAIEAITELSQQGQYVPGVLRCPKCSLEVIKSNLNMGDGSITANNNPDACPNGCGPLWKVSERDGRIEAQKAFDDLWEEFQSLKKAQQGQWVSVEDRLPEADVQVLIDQGKDISDRYDVDYVDVCPQYGHEFFANYDGEVVRWKYIEPPKDK